MRSHRPSGHEPRWPECPACGASRRPGVRFCPRCGEPFSEDDVRAAPPPLPVPGEEAPERIVVRDRRGRGFEGAGDRLWRELRPVLWFFLALLGTSAAALVYLRLGGEPSPMLLLVETLVDAVITLAFVATEWRSVGPALTRFGLRGPDALLPGLVLLGLAVFFAVYFRGLSLLGLEEPGLIPLFRENGWSLVWAFVLVSAAPAVFEELGFRGFVQGRLERILGPTEALLTQAALFSVIHLSVFILVSHFVMGIALGFLRRRTGSLYPGMIVHAAWNAGVLMLELV